MDRFVIRMEEKALLNNTRGEMRGTGRKKSSIQSISDCKTTKKA
jgi:hypothetical protein